MISHQPPLKGEVALPEAGSEGFRAMVHPDGKTEKPSPQKTPGALSERPRLAVKGINQWNISLDILSTSRATAS